eukprot:Colp12_sorted_trinity150504_noHs@27288
MPPNQESLHEYAPALLEPLHSLPEPAPVVLITGFFGIGDFYWGQLSEMLTTALKPQCGPASSQHDRVCEIFYQLVGGTVDYGEEHSRKHGHARYGRAYPEPLHPNWSEAHPVHLIGHSMGGCTARALQQYLEEKRFPGYSTSARWIRSITTVASPHNGATTTYILGEHEEGDGEVWPLSFGWCLTKLAHVYEWLDIATFRDFFDLHLDHWGLSRHQDQPKDKSSLSKLWNDLKKSKIFEGNTDNGPYDMTCKAMSDWNDRIKIYPDTYYLSIAGTASSQWLPGYKYHVPNWAAHPVLYGMGLLMGRKTFAKENLVAEGFKSEDHWENDGVVSFKSQMHPRACGEIECEHTKGEIPSTLGKPGVWQVVEMEMNHIGIVPFPRCLKKQRNFFADLINRLHRIDMAEHKRRHPLAYSMTATSIGDS